MKTKYQISKPVLALLSEGILDTEYGEFKMSVFHDGHEQAIVLSKGKLAGQDNVLCRIHSECVSAHFFSGLTCDCKQQMVASQRLIQQAGKGLIILLEQEGRGCGAAAHVATLDLKRNMIDQPEAYRMAGFPDDIRRYDMAAKIIQYWQIKSVVLISSNVHKIAFLKDWGIDVVGSQEISSFIILGRSADNRVAYIKKGESKPVVDKSESDRWIFVVGDLNMDYIISPTSFPQSGILDKPKPIIGGTAFNAAVAFKDKGFEPIVFGKIGNDSDGQYIQQELESRSIKSLVGISEDRHTGTCSVIFVEGTKQRWLIKEENNANDYDLDYLKQSLHMSQIGSGDFVFLVGHPFVRLGIDHTKKLVDMISQTGAKMILDVVPHNMHESITFDQFNHVIEDKVSILIGEYNTLMQLAGCKVIQEHPTPDDMEALFGKFRSRVLVVRSGIGSISKQIVCKRIPHGATDLGAIGVSGTKSVFLRELRTTLETYFNDEELRTLCFDLTVDYDNLGGEGKAGKARELIAHLDRHGTIHDLLVRGMELRRQVSWPRLASYQILEDKETGYANAPIKEKRGFGDALTAGFLSEFYSDL